MVQGGVDGKHEIVFGVCHSLLPKGVVQYCECALSHCHTEGAGGGWRAVEAHGHAGGPQSMSQSLPKRSCSEEET